MALSRFFKFRLSATVLSVAFSCVQLLYATTIDTPAISSRSAILLDATSGEILYEKNPDIEIPPASLTKLMTMHITLQEIESGRLSLDEPVNFTKAAWAINQPWGSSLMFLGPGQTVTLRELLLGLSVDSGNDAAVAVAVRVSGGIPAFVQRMNEEARDLGLIKTHFVEPSGISEKNITTAREFAEFCRAYLQRHPTVLKDFHSVREFAFPKAENVSEAFRSDPKTITQYNRNLLLGEIEGVDGLKTGYIIEAGYNIALTGERSGTRFLAILLGGPGTSSARGGRIRADDGGKLLSWGFDHFKTIRPSIENLEPFKIWKGAKGKVELEAGTELSFTVRKNRATALSYEVIRYKGVTAPVGKGTQLGEIRFSDEEGLLKNIPLVAKEEVKLGSPLRRALDSVSLFFLRLFGKLT
ncbi:MAG: D-alanyl-D-alanine carboxypeptidase family protein [Treponemataceae bacterium]